MGSSKANVDAVVAQGLAGWLDGEFAMPRAISHWDWLVQAGYATAATQNNQQGFDPVMWRQLISSADQLRQRVGMALLDFLVVGIDGVNVPWRQFEFRRSAFLFPVRRGNGVPVAHRPSTRVTGHGRLSLRGVL